MRAFPFSKEQKTKINIRERQKSVRKRDGHFENNKKSEKYKNILKTIRLQ
jgi:hypothetical protein